MIRTRQLDSYRDSGHETDLTILHVSMALNDRAIILTRRHRSQYQCRQARGDTTGQSDHECMAFRSQSAVPGVAGEIEGILQQDDIGIDSSGWPKARYS